MRKLLTTGLSIIVLCLLTSTTFAYEEESVGNKLPIGASENLDKIIKGNVAAEAINGDVLSSKNGWRNFLTDSDLVITINIIIGAVAVLWLVILGILFILNQGKEDELAQYKQRIGWTILGLFVVALAEFVAFNVFNPVENNLIGEDEALKNLIEKVKQIKLYFEIVVVGIMLILGGLSGFNLIMGAEDDDTLETEKNFIKNFLFGFALILLAEVAVRIFTNKTINDLSPDFDPTESTKIFITETVGIINMILTYFGAAATFMMILSSLYYITSLGNEDQMNRAKQIVISCVVAIVIAFSSYTIVAFLTR